MSKFFISLAIVFSLLIAPIAHAAGTACLNDNGKSISKVELKILTSEDGSQKNDKAEKSAHCCCSHTVSDRTTMHAVEPVMTTAKVVIPAEDESISTLSYGPPLKPPSHA